VTLASAENAITELILEAAKLHGSDPDAPKLRQMNLSYEMNKERGTTVLIPTGMANIWGGGCPDQGNPGRFCLICSRAA
jgi:hypothetical protein